MTYVPNNHRPSRTIALLVHAYYLRDARVRRFADALADDGFEVDVFCLRDKGESPRETHQGVRIIRIPYTRVRGGKLSYYFEYALSLLMLGLYLTAFHFRRKYSVVHINTPPDALILAGIVPMLSGAKLILDYHDLMPELYMAKYELEQPTRLVKVLLKMERYSALLADGVLTACTRFRDNLTARSVQGKPVHIIRNLPDPKLFGLRRNAFRRDTSRFTLLYIGTISDRYGCDLAIRALPQLRTLIPAIKLRIVGKISGEGSYKQTLQTLVAQMGVGDIVEFGPPVPLDRVAEEMGKCDIGVYTPIHDIHMDHAFSLKVGEFAAMGVPMVTTRTPVMEEYLGADGAAYVEPDDVDGFVKQVMRLHSDAEFRSSVIRAGDEFTENNNWDSERRSYLKVVNGLVSGQPDESLYRELRGGVKRSARAAITSAHYCSRKLLGSKNEAGGVRILTYHDVLPVPQNEWSVAASRFAEQMRWLADHYAVVSLDEVADWLKGGRELPAGAIAVTFDDGLRGVYDHAFPALERHGIPATVFVVEQFTRSGKTMKGMPTLTPEVLQLMAKNGVSIGCHSRSHLSLGSSTLSSAALTAETLGSKRGLEQMLSMDIRHFAYPYGTARDLGQDVVLAVEKAGYELGLSSIHGRVDPSSDRFQLRRVKVEGTDSLSTFAELVCGGMDSWAWIDNYASWLQAPRNIAPVLSERTDI